MRLVTGLASLTLLSASAAGAQPPATQEEDDSLRGTVGVCIRWGADPNHVADAVVVVPSGNPTLDDAIPNTIRAMTWERPAHDYHGEWVGITMAVSGGTSKIPLPTCDPKRLPRAKPNV